MGCVDWRRETEGICKQFVVVILKLRFFSAKLCGLLVTNNRKNDKLKFGKAMTMKNGRRWK
jgi:hypothetical protein